MIYSGTGHRPNKLNNAYDLNHPTAQAIMKKVKTFFIETHLKKGESIEIISGMALGFDTYLAQVAIDLKKEFPGLVKLIAAIPCQGHGGNWPASSQKVYKYLLANSDEEVLVTNDVFKPYYMQVRNEYMVNRADKVISLWDGSKGGTGNCIDYAKKVKKEIINLHPSLLVWEIIKDESEEKEQLSLFD